MERRVGAHGGRYDIRYDVAGDRPSWFRELFYIEVLKMSHSAQKWLAHHFRHLVADYDLIWAARVAGPCEGRSIILEHNPVEDTNTSRSGPTDPNGVGGVRLTCVLRSGAGLVFERRTHGPSSAIRQLLDMTPQKGEKMPAAWAGLRPPALVVRERYVEIGRRN